MYIICIVYTVHTLCFGDHCIVYTVHKYIVYGRLSIVYTIHKYIVYRAQNLRQGIVMKTSFGTWVSQMGLPSFVDIDIFVLKYYFI